MAFLTDITSRARAARKQIRRRARGRWWVTRVAVRRALGLAPPDPVGRLIFEFARTHPGAFVVQVGAYDGSQLDPIERYIRTRGWRGVLVEPNPAGFARLRSNYADVEGLVFENAAIAPHEGTVDLYYLAESNDPDLPPWYDALASLRKDVLLSHERVIPGIEQRVRSIEVPCLTFDALCRKHGIEHIDVVQIDTEGFDFEIVKMIDFDRFRPPLVQFEELHMDEQTRRACRDHLARYGYGSLPNGMDCLCLNPDRLGPQDGRLRNLWQRLTAT